MYLQLDRGEHQLITKLVEGRIRELRPESGPGHTHTDTEKLKQELEAYERILHRLHESECDVTA